MTTPAIALPTLTLSKAEDDLVSALRNRLASVRTSNLDKSKWYEADQDPKDLGIATPRGMSEQIQAVLGWPGTIVDVLEERLEFRGWSSSEGTRLGDVFRDNQLAVESGRGHLDTLIYGVGFVAVGVGDVDAGEPDVLVTAESTESCTVEWDYRLRRARSALSQTRDERGTVVMETLYLPDATIRFEVSAGGRLAVVSRDDHNLGRVPIARMLNRDRASDVMGRSEITRAIRYYTAAGARTLTGLEVNREFYTTPKYTVTNTDPAVFGLDEGMSEQAKRDAKWSSTAGNMNVIPPQIDPETDAPVQPQLHEFRPSSPAPFAAQIETYAQLVAAEAGIPAPYLGFQVPQGTSADSIIQQEYRLVKRAERRQASFGAAWMEVARLALMMRGEFDPVAFREIGVTWRDAATPTRSAAADEAAKLIGVGVLPPESSVTRNRVGLSPQEQQQLDADQRKSTIGALVEKIGAQPAAVDEAGSTAVDAATELKVKFEALGIAVRAGVDPEDAASRLGLSGVKFTGAMPVSLRPLESDAARLEGR